MTVGWRFARRRLAIGIRLLASWAVALAAWGSVRAEPAERDLRQALGFAQRGLSAFEKGNGSRAREDFARALAKVPDLPDAHLGLGHLAMREKRFEDALREYRTAREGFTRLAALLQQFSGERYLRSRDELQRLQAERSDLDKAVARAQSRAGAGTGGSGGSGAAQIMRQSMELDQRIRTLESMGPPDAGDAKEVPANLYFFEGNALFDLGRLDEAVAAWERAAERDPSFALVQNNLAVAYWRKGRIEEAQSALRRAESLGFQVNPNFRADLARAARADARTPAR